MTRLKRRCIRCGYEWIPLKRHPAQCPHCHSTRWDKPYSERTLRMLEKAKEQRESYVAS